MLRCVEPVEPKSPAPHASGAPRALRGRARRAGELPRGLLQFHNRVATATAMSRLIDACDAWLLRHPSDRAATLLRAQQVDGLDRLLDRLEGTRRGFSQAAAEPPEGTALYFRGVGTEGRPAAGGGGRPVERPDRLAERAWGTGGAA